MSDNKLECTDSYILPTGPIGDKGPVGPQGQQGTYPATPPTGATGLPGRTKIDITFSSAAANDYREISSNDISSNYFLLGTFIYPGNAVFGGDPTNLKLIIQPSGFDTGLITTAVSLVELNTIPTGTTVDDIANNYAILNEQLRLGTNGVVRAANITRSLDTLPDTECLIGIYVKKTDFSTLGTTTVKYYSAELY